MGKLIWTLGLAVAALLVTFAAGSALQIAAEANTTPVVEQQRQFVVDESAWRRGVPPKEVSFRERIVSAVRAFRDGKE